MLVLRPRANLSAIAASCRERPVSHHLLPHRRGLRQIAPNPTPSCRRGVQTLSSTARTLLLSELCRRATREARDRTPTIASRLLRLGGGSASNGARAASRPGP